EKQRQGASGGRVQSHAPPVTGDSLTEAREKGKAQPLRLSTSALAAGTHIITAVYKGDATFKATTLSPPVRTAVSPIAQAGAHFRVQLSLPIIFSAASSISPSFATLVRVLMSLKSGRSCSSFSTLLRT